MSRLECIACGNYLFSFTWKPNHLSGKVNSLCSLLIKNVSDSMKFPISEISSPSQDLEGTQWHSGYSELNHSWNKNSSARTGKEGEEARRVENSSGFPGLFLSKAEDEKGKPRAKPCQPELGQWGGTSFDFSWKEGIYWFLRSVILKTFPASQW